MVYFRNNKQKQTILVIIIGSESFDLDLLTVFVYFFRVCDVLINTCVSVVDKHG